MGKYPVPEILRVPLESISLTVKVMREEEDVKLFLSRAIDPPKVASMQAAWTVLEELGAVDLQGRLTPLGRHISQLPVDLRLAKVRAYVRSCTLYSLGLDDDIRYAVH